jgi:prepilin signal peptidase PulO-like enzyme (type II secretory pathway)
MEESTHLEAAAAVRDVTSRTDRALVGIPVLVTTGLGLLFGLTRFVMLLIEDLREPPDNWKPVAMFVVLIGSAAAMIVMASALVGLLAGAVLRACVSWVRRAGPRRRAGGRAAGAV